jgi:hypothetical protein
LPHSIIEEKVRTIGVTVVGQPLAWLINFLQNRKQRVRYEYVLSAPSGVTSGVVQGLW